MTKITGYQIVHADERGDDCYKDKKGWYFHALGPLTEILTDTVTGPYDTSAEATIACDRAQRQLGA